MKRKTTRPMIRELIENYIREKDIGSYIDNLWDRIGGELRAKGSTERISVGPSGNREKVDDRGC